MAQFLACIAHDDFSTTITNRAADKNHLSLAKAQKIITEKLQQLKAEKSIQHEYLHLVIEHVETALICFDQSNNVEMINNAAKKLLKATFIPSLKKISSIDPALAKAMTEIHTGEQVLAKTTLDSEPIQIMLTANEFTLLQNQYKLISLQNVKMVLDEKEIESWQKLIRVINHEIINSMTPIVSLSRYVATFLTDKSKVKKITDANSAEFYTLKRSIDTIHLRSQGLVNFISAYRGLNRVHRYAFTAIDVAAFFQRLSILLDEKLRQKNIIFQTQTTKSGATVLADEGSLEQVVINLIYNAMESLQETTAPRIVLEYCLNRHGKALIQVTDNGSGIKQEYIDNIFTPFFSTKERSSGIGLSVSRQLARLNNASLTVKSQENCGSTFTLTFHASGK
ncbi:sensor histidine kinase [Exilibacterium tricleocarpae]|nr:ATP-binding protein [Exilibacterium tricleocarpae]